MSRASERRTIEAMVHLYCEERHGPPHPCPECLALLEYAAKRLDACPYGEGKPVCAKCPVHCYAPRWRERIRDVMRSTGPRLLWRHPLLAVRHLLQRLRAVPGKRG